MKSLKENDNICNELFLCSEIDFTNLVKSMGVNYKGEKVASKHKLWVI